MASYDLYPCRNFCSCPLLNCQVIGKNKKKCYLIHVIQILFRISLKIQSCVLWIIWHLIHLFSLYSNSYLCHNLQKFIFFNMIHMIQSMIQTTWKIYLHVATHTPYPDTKFYKNRSITCWFLVTKTLNLAAILDLC